MPIMYNMNMNKDFLKKVVDLSKESYDQGKFLAGAVLAKNGKIVYMENSNAYPNQHLHAEMKIIDKALDMYKAGEKKINAS